MSRTKKIAYGLTAAAITLGAGLGVVGVASVASASDAHATVVGSATIGMHGDGDRGPGGPDRGDLATALATKLGIAEADVATALQDFRDANRPTELPSEGTKPDRAALQSALAASLADSLGLTVADVTAALDEVHAADQADHGAALKTRLDEGVADGTLTQAEADAVTKAIEAGVIGGGRP